jgi:hypothetical protein
MKSKGYSIAANPFFFSGFYPHFLPHFLSHFYPCSAPSSWTNPVLRFKALAEQSRASNLFGCDIQVRNAPAARCEAA